MIGAGFSRNWNGWLASEFFDFLITEPSIRGNQAVLDALTREERDGGGFEGALSKLQEATSRSTKRKEAIQDLKVLQDSVLGVFTLMNKGFFEFPGIDFSNHREASLRDFLAKFDAIFSLNQDLLLEKHYVDVPNPSNPGVILPGITPPPNLAPFELERWLREPWIVEDSLVETEFGSNLQPLFKLHGSANWRARTGADLIVLGGQKAKAIRESSVLSWYHEEFSRRICQPGARLMTIGYGFQDPHINSPILSSENLSLFVVDPLGIQVGLRPQDRRTDGIRVQNPLEECNIIGISKRPLSSTFGTDSLEREKLMTFFGS